MKNVKNAFAKDVSGASMPWALWNWNGEITRADIEDQMAEFIAKGFGGVAIRPGRDMLPVYMSQEFIENFRCALEIAKQNKIAVRFADDLSLIYPGCADGIINKSRKLRAEYLVFEGEVTLPQGVAEGEIPIDPEYEYIAQAIRRGAKATIEVKQVTVPEGKDSFVWKAPGAEWSLLLYKKEPVYGPAGCGTFNVLNQKGVFSYIEDTLETLKSGISEYVQNNTFEGLITEMPALRPGGDAIYWDDDIAVKYKSRYKREFMPMLPALFLELPEAEKLRMQAYSFITDLIAERFTAVLESWAKKYRLSQWVLWPEIGIYKPENALVDAHIPTEPAISTLGLQNLDGSIVNSAVLRAVADANTNRFRRETLTVIGRNRSGIGCGLQDLKREIDLSLFAGPSRIIVDGFYANTEQRSGYRAPHNTAWYSPEWEHAKLLFTYSARAQEMLIGLQRSREVAVLNPSDAIMSDYIPSDVTAANIGLTRFRQTVDALTRLGKGFDIVTEELLLTCQLRVDGSFATTDRIRKGNYQALVVPHASFVTRSLLVYLEKLAVKGTTLVFIDELPKGTFEDGAAASVVTRIEKLSAPRRGSVSVIPAAQLEQPLAGINPDALIMRDTGESADIGVQVYHGEGGRLYMFHNTLENNEQAVTVSLLAEKFFTAIDIATGEMYEIEPQSVERNTARLRLSFTPLQTMFIAATPVKLAPPSPPQGHFNPFALPARSYRIIFKDNWEFEAVTPNVLPLSNWNVRMGISRESGQISHFYETTFEVKELPGSCMVIMNGMSKSNVPFQGVEISINGVRIDERYLDEDSPWLDSIPARMFGKYALCAEIGGDLTKGINRLSIRTTGSAVDPQTLVYPPMVVGYFGITKGSYGLAIDKQAVSAGHESWTKSGYPYMSGRARYSQIFEVPSDYDRLVLRFSNTSGTVYAKINDVDIGMQHWPPMELDVTSYCNVQRNKLQIEVVNTIDNTLRLSGRASGLKGEVYIDVYKMM